jgi:uncharacterized protein
MQIYLPIAEMSANWLLLISLGGVVGFLSGVFGVGGGFLMTPLLIFLGIPPAVAVGTGVNQIVASSVSGAIAHWRRDAVDFAMGFVMLAGGLVGSVIGVWLFGLLRRFGQVDAVIAITYVVLLGLIGGLMLRESVQALFRRSRSAGHRRKLHEHNWLHGLPFKMRFRKSKLYISSILPFSLGVFVGVLASIMGVGGGFVMVPAMIYMLGMPTAVVTGTSLFQITFVSAAVTVLQAFNNQTVDIVLAAFLLGGGVLGVELGSRVGRALRGDQFRSLLAIIVIAVAVRMAFELFMPPEEPFSLAFPEPF